MKKTKLYGSVVIGLLLLNLGLLGFIYFSNNKAPINNGPKEHIIKTLELDEEQIIAYEKSIETHRTAVHSKSKELNEMRTAIFECIKNNDEAKALKLQKEIGQKQTELEAIHYNHFLYIKSICREDQLEKFEQLLEEVGEMFQPGGGIPPGPPNKFPGEKRPHHPPHHPPH